MTLIKPIKFLQPEEILTQSRTDPPYLLLARSDLYADRAMRLRTLAAGHPMSDYLRFAAQIAQAQHEALGRADVGATVDSTNVARANEAGTVLLDVSSHARGAVWRDILRDVLRTMRDRAQALPPQVMAMLASLQTASDEHLDVQADKLLNGIGVGLDRASAPVVGAALQVYWSRLAAAYGKDAFPRTEHGNACPVCASRPVASVARIGSDESGYRYLHCSVCESEWHMVRIKCTQCESTRSVSYHQIEGGSEAIRAETCDECGTYLKIFHMDKDPGVDPVADDLASMSLDLLIGEAGYLRSGQNLLLVQGEAES